MNYKDFDLFPEEIPSPEELFQIDLSDTVKPERTEETLPRISDLPVEDKAAVTKPMEARMADEKLVRAKAEDAKPAEAQMADEKLVRAKAIDGKQAEAVGAESQEEGKQTSGKTKPRRRTVKIFTAGFVILILVIALFITNMDKFHLHCYCMMTDSMGDTIPKGSVVFSYEIPMDELVVGDVITYINSQGVSVTHQIVSEIYDYNESGSRAFYTKGTENDTVDEDPVTYDMIKGKVAIYIPYIARPFIH